IEGKGSMPSLVRAYEPAIDPDPRAVIDRPEVQDHTRPFRIGRDIELAFVPDIAVKACVMNSALRGLGGERHEDRVRPLGGLGPPLAVGAGFAPCKPPFAVEGRPFGAPELRARVIEIAVAPSREEELHRILSLGSSARAWLVLFSF